MGCYMSCICCVCVSVGMSVGSSVCEGLMSDVSAEVGVGSCLFSLIGSGKIM